jgi:hypothetical protein
VEGYFSVGLFGVRHTAAECRWWVRTFLYVTTLRGTWHPRRSKFRSSEPCTNPKHKNFPAGKDAVQHTKLNLPYLHSERPWSNSKIHRKAYRDSRMASNAAPLRGLIPTFSGFKTPTCPLGSDCSSKYWGATNFEKQLRCQSLHDDTIF